MRQSVVYIRFGKQACLNLSRLGYLNLVKLASQPVIPATQFVHYRRGQRVLIRTCNFTYVYNETLEI